MEQATLTPRDYVMIARRRKWWFILPAASLFVLSFVLAMVWPPTYRSEATILVEQPEIPQDLVGTVENDYLEQRLQAITRRVLVSDNLISIIQRYGLYADARERAPLSAVVEKMREVIVMTPITTETTDSNGRTATRTIAFTLGFDYENAETAQRVTNELVSLYLNENLRQRREKATEATAFLRGERERSETQITKLERELTAFRQANDGSLPEQVQNSQQAAARAEEELRRIDSQIQSAKERISSTESQLALTEPFQLYSTTSKTLTPTAQLESLRTQLTTLRARYGATHPDVVRTGREVAALEQALGVGSGSAGLEREREQVRIALETARQRYTPDHPDVVQAQRRLDTIDATLRAAPRGSTTSRPDNPAYIQLQSTLSAARAELSASTEQRQRVVEALRQHGERMSRATLIDADYQRLRGRLDEAIKQRDELVASETTARLGQTLEVEAKSERFALIEPPSFPLEPVKPSKPLIVLVGLVLAVGSGVGLAAGTHMLDDSIWSTRDVAKVIGEVPLAVVPEVVTAQDAARRWAIRLLVLALVAAVVGALLWYVHVNVIPLDVLALNIQLKLTGMVEAFTGGGDAAAPAAGAP